MRFVTGQPPIDLNACTAWRDVFQRVVEGAVAQQLRAERHTGKAGPRDSGIARQRRAAGKCRRYQAECRARIHQADVGKQRHPRAQLATDQQVI